MFLSDALPNYPWRRAPRLRSVARPRSGCPRTITRGDRTLLAGHRSCTRPTRRWTHAGCTRWRCGTGSGTRTRTIGIAAAGRVGRACLDVRYSCWLLRVEEPRESASARRRSGGRRRRRAPRELLVSHAVQAQSGKNLSRDILVSQFRLVFI